MVRATLVARKRESRALTGLALLPNPSIYHWRNERGKGTCPRSHPESASDLFSSHNLRSSLCTASHVSVTSQWVGRQNLCCHSIDSLNISRVAASTSMFYSLFSSSGNGSKVSARINFPIGLINAESKPISVSTTPLQQRRVSSTGNISQI